MALTPVVSATYEPADFEKKLNTQSHLVRLETINRAVMSGRPALVDESVMRAQKNIANYHQSNISALPKVGDSMPVLGMSSLKTATLKHSQNAMG